MATKKNVTSSENTEAIKTEATVNGESVSNNKKSEDTPKKIVSKDIDVNQFILVRNGFEGQLTYTSSRTGETFIWDNFGDSQEIELRELRNAKNAQKAFFTNNWFMFDDDDKWVIDYLGVGQYYKHAIDVDDFDKLFDLSESEIASKVKKLSDGQKGAVIYRAHKLIAEGKIDSLKKIAALEKALGVELIEK